MLALQRASERAIRDLNRLGIHNSEEFVSYLPYKYEDFTYTNEYSAVDKQRMVIYGMLVSVMNVVRKDDFEMIWFNFISLSSNIVYKVKAYNMGYLKTWLYGHIHFTIVGTFQKFKNEIILSKVKKSELKPEEYIQPVYHLTDFFNQHRFKNLMRITISMMESNYVDNTPKSLQKRYNLMKYTDALFNVHFPKNTDALRKALRTLKYNECIEFILKNRIIEEENKSFPKIDKPPMDNKKIFEMINNLNLTLTHDQKTAIKEIVFDMKKPRLMNRLLQGEVGTGKTLVAAICLYANYLRGKQGVILEPIEILATQTYIYLIDKLEKYGVRIKLLIGSLKEKERNIIKDELENNEIDILVGTHASFSNDVSYSNLAFAIIDEQQKFGVNQRSLLKNKGENVDLLLMSATPIPQTLASIFYGNIDISVLKEYPFEKKKVVTKVCTYESPKINGLIDYCINLNKQVFIVCPLISSRFDVEYAAERAYTKYKEIYGDKVGLLHSKLSTEEKEKVINDFKEKRILILVTTTIVEIGLDIKEARGMIVLGANRFGLSSLHQLRGRVGRNGDQAYCLLVEDKDDINLGRLQILEKTDDGFVISEEDLRLRGPGDYIGDRQSGYPAFSCLNIIRDRKIYNEVFNDIKLIFSKTNDDYYANYLKELQEYIKKPFNELSLFD